MQETGYGRNGNPLVRYGNHNGRMNLPMGEEFRRETQYKRGLGKLSLETRTEHIENWRDRFLFWRQLNPDYIITGSCQERIKKGMKITRGLEPCALEGWGVLCQPFRCGKWSTTCIAAGVLRNVYTISLEKHSSKTTHFKKSMWSI